MQGCANPPHPLSVVGPQGTDVVSGQNGVIRSPKDASEKGGNGNGVYSVSRMFHRNSLRSLSLASVSDLTKA